MFNKLDKLSQKLDGVHFILSTKHHLDEARQISRLSVHDVS